MLRRVEAGPLSREPRDAACGARAGGWARWPPKKPPAKARCTPSTRCARQTPSMRLSLSPDPHHLVQLRHFTTRPDRVPNCVIISSLPGRSNTEAGGSDGAEMRNNGQLNANLYFINGSNHFDGKPPPYISNHVALSGGAGNYDGYFSGTLCRHTSTNCVSSAHIHKLYVAVQCPCRPR
jgi:hypothetical protein